MNLYFEMYSGISGDMTIGALLDLGASREKLEEGIKSLGIDGYELVFEKLKKNGIDAYNFDTKIQEGHVHRHLSDIYEIIDRGSFNDNVKNKAKKIFDIIADSEAKAHAVDKQEIHFHEVGAMDSIIDIVGVSILLDDLNVENVYFSDLYDITFDSIIYTNTKVYGKGNIIITSSINITIIYIKYIAIDFLSCIANPIINSNIADIVVDRFFIKPDTLYRLSTLISFPFLFVIMEHTENVHHMRVKYTYIPITIKS